MNARCNNSKSNDVADKTLRCEKLICPKEPYMLLHAAPCSFSLHRSRLDDGQCCRSAREAPDEYGSRNELESPIQSLNGQLGIVRECVERLWTCQPPASVLMMPVGLTLPLSVWVDHRHHLTRSVLELREPGGRWMRWMRWMHRGVGGSVIASTRCCRYVSRGADQVQHRRVCRREQQGTGTEHRGSAALGMEVQDT